MKLRAPIVLYVLAAASILFMWLAPASASRLGVEDGPIENATALLFLLSGVFMAYQGLRLISSRDSARLVGLISIIIALMFVVFAGEEISWGQRIFDFETGEFMTQNNWQNETNLHNLHTDIANLGFHFGALFFLVIFPIFRSKTNKYAGMLRLEALTEFIAPIWLAAPSLVFLGMLDSRFVFMIEKPWAATFYLLALAIGLVVLVQLLVTSRQRANRPLSLQLYASLTLIALGLAISYIYAIDEQATNIISEYKEFYIAAALFVFAINWRYRPKSSGSRHPLAPNTAQES